jgi:molybdopterin-synthase adenylyltransferase
MYARVTVPPLGGGWCLMCGNIIDLHKAALESAPAEIDRLVANAGYLDGIDAPAVFWLNNICASTGVGVIHGIVSGFIDVAAGIDWIYEFPNHQWHKTNPEYLQTDDCYFCG